VAKIAVVGGCGSGKTTIVHELQTRGYDAYVVGQEHSGVPDLWNRRRPDVVIYLDVTLEAVRQRRSEGWPEWLYNVQQRRLQSASDEADIHVNTAELTVEQTMEQIIKSLESNED
jgi:GTPase SAR1 family protein